VRWNKTDLQHGCGLPSANRESKVRQWLLWPQARDLPFAYPNGIVMTQTSVLEGAKLCQSYWLEESVVVLEISVGCRTLNLQRRRRGTRSAVKKSAVDEYMTRLVSLTLEQD
jgi:hypothetical protein